MTRYSVFAYIICFITSVSSGLGAGGGGILTLYLSLFSGMRQIFAQGVNLVDFTFALAPAAVINTIKYKPDIRVAAFLTFCGTVGCVLGALLSSNASDVLLRRCYGAFLAAAGAIVFIRAAKTESRS